MSKQLIMLRCSTAGFEIRKHSSFEMIYGYARVSTGAQDLTDQLAKLEAAGCEKVFRDELTGATAGRPQLRRLVLALRGWRRGYHPDG
jgi:Resolvase, N terminal domain